MIHWKVLEKITKEIDEKYPELPEKARTIMAMKVYNELERRVLTGEGSPNSPVGVISKYPFT